MYFHPVFRITQYQDRVRNGRLGTAIIAAIISTTTILYNCVIHILCYHILVYPEIVGIATQTRNPNLEYKGVSQPTARSYIRNSFFGGVIGGVLLTTHIANKLGRKSGLLWNNVAILLSALFMWAGVIWRNMYCLLLVQFFAGFYTGVNSALVPLYLTEISPGNKRGGVGSLFYLVFVLSSQLTGFFGPKETLDVGTFSLLWPFTLLACLIPPLVQLMMLPFCPESPRYTYHFRRDPCQTRKSLLWLRGESAEVEGLIDQEIDELNSECERDANNQPNYKPLKICCMLMFAQQLCAYIFVDLYGENLFSIIYQHNAVATKAATIGYKFATLTTIGMAIVMVDRVGRRPLLLFSFITILTSLLIIVAVNMLTFVARFSNSKPVDTLSMSLLLLCGISVFAGLGPIPWFYACEAFPTRTRALSTCIAVIVNWTTRYIVELGVVNLLIFVFTVTLPLFMGLLGIFSFVVWKKMPETKGSAS